MSLDKKGLCIGIITLLFCTQFLTLSLILPQGISKDEKQTLNIPRFAADHEPIILTGGNIAAYFLGNTSTGLSWGSAYVLQNMTIDGGLGVSPIQISSSTSRYLIVRNCTLKNSNQSNGYAGIVLNTVSNVKIENCSIQGNYDGIRLTGCNNVFIDNNTVITNARYGVYSSSTPLATVNITSNLILGFQMFSIQPIGIYLDGASNHIIEKNVILGSDTYGINLVNAADTNTIRKNSFLAGNNGVYLNGVSNNIIEWNNITNNYGTGISIAGNFVGGNTIQRNNVSYNGVGIDSNSITFTANNIYWNIFSNNTAVNGTEGNPLTTNTWHDGAFGNYWGEYVYEHVGATNNGLTWNTAHAIDGSSAATDAHPIVNAQFIYNIAPTITTPADQVITSESVSNMLTWTVTDDTSQTPVYNLTVNSGSKQINVPLTSGVPIIVNLDDLTTGTYIYQIIANDGFGLTVSDSVLITVVQTLNQSQILQTSSYGAAGNDMGLGICTFENASYTVGTTTSYGAGGSDLVVLKWDENGNQLWNKTWGGALDETGNGVWANNSVVYTVGSTRSYGIGESDILLVKWNATNGNQIWNKTLGQLGVDSGNAIWANESHIFTAGSMTTSGNLTDTILTQWLEDGTVVYSQTWGGSSADLANAIWVNSTDVYVYGTTESYDVLGGDMFILRYDVSGNMLFNKTSGCSMAVAGNSLWSDGISLFGLGSIVNSSQTNTDLILFCMSAEGDQVWNRTFGGLNIEVGRGIIGNETGLYVTGYTESFGATGRNGLFLKYSIDGDLMQNVSVWDGSGTDQLMAIAGNDSYIWTTGYSGANANTLVLLKWDANCTAPRSFAINPQINYINLTWTAPSNNGSYTPIIGYNIYRSTLNNSFTDLPIPVGPYLVYQDNGVLKGVTYYYKVCAVTINGENALSGFFGGVAYRNINDSVDLNKTFSMSGTGWVGQTDTVFFDGDAAQSNPVAAGGATSISTIVTGPGVLIFTWKVSSQANLDYLYFNDNGTQVASISGEVNWVEYRYYIKPGLHTLEWRYERNLYLPAAGQDKAWVDMIQFSPIIPLNPIFPIYYDGIIGQNNMSVIYNLSLNGGDNITLGLDGNAFVSPHLDLYLYNSTFGLIVSNTTGSSMNTTTIVPATDQYYIRIFNAGYANENPYFGNVSKIIENSIPQINIKSPQGLNLSAQTISVDFWDQYSLDDAYYRIDTADTGFVNDTTGWYPIFVNNTGSSSSMTFQIDQTYWGTFSNGATHVIYFKVWDDVGNYQNGTGFSLTVFKDIGLPSITVTPLTNVYWAANQTITTLFMDTYSLGSAYYIIDTALPAGMTTTLMTSIFTDYHTNFNIVQFSITATQWTGLGQGVHTLRIKAWDNATNVQNANVTFYKDTNNPELTIKTTNRTEYTKTPSILIDVNDTIALKSVYFKIDSREPTGTELTGWTAISTSLTGIGTTINFTLDAATFAGLAAGEHAMYFKVLDQANNVYNPTLNTWNFIKKLLPTTPTLSAIPAINTNGTIVLSWTASEHVVSYYVYRSTVPFTTFNVDDLEAIAVVTTGTSYTDKMPLNGTYYYIVAGRNADGFGAASNMINVTIGIPPAGAGTSPGIIGGFTMMQLIIVAAILAVALIVALVVQGSVLKKKYLTAADQSGAKSKPSGKPAKQEQFDFSKVENKPEPKKTAPTPRPAASQPQETKKIIKDEKPPANARACPNCGSKIEATSTFCPFCGRTLD